jgi:predicted nucleic acid-binding protein
MIYLDASALITFITGREPCPALESFLADHPGQRIATSRVGLVETVRGCEQMGHYPGLMAALLDEAEEVPFTRRIRDVAAMMPAGLRSLDAIHVASADVLASELTAIVTYDKRMAKAARRVGLPVATPGME